MSTFLTQPLHFREQQKEEKERKSRSELLTGYLKASMFDGFAEIAEDKPTALKLFWILIVIIASLVCTGFVIKVFVEYGQQKVTQKVTTERLPAYPIITLCVDPRRQARIQNGSVPMRTSQMLHDTARCALSGTCTSNYSGESDILNNLTAKRYLKWYNESVGYSSFETVDMTIRPNCRGFACPKTVSVTLRWRDYLNDFDGVLCREFEATEKPMPGKLHFETTINLTRDYFTEPNGAQFHVYLREEGFEDSRYHFHSLNYDNFEVGFSMSANRLVENCEKDKYQATKQRQKCKSRLVYTMLGFGCCLCTNDIGQCPDDDTRCCLLGDIPANFSKTLIQECGEETMLPPCESVEFKQTTFEYFSLCTSQNANCETHKDAEFRQQTVNIEFGDVSNLLVIEEYYPISFSQALGSFGGVLSLFIGGSIMAFIHVIYYFCGNAVVRRVESREDR